MQYTFDVYGVHKGMVSRYDTTTNVDEVVHIIDSLAAANASFSYVDITDNTKVKDVIRVTSIAALEEWCDTTARTVAWKTQFLPVDALKDPIMSAVDPKHYKSYVQDLQWLDAMSQIPTLRDKNLFASALELQIRKYLDRNGQKDSTVQELKKARFYLQALIDWLETGQISATQIHDKLPK